MIPVVCIVGRSGSGKTRLVEALARELTRRGRRVATLKHTHHAPGPDRAGSDTWRHAAAGAAPTVLSGPGFAMMREYPGEPELDRLLLLLAETAEVVLVEGYKHTSYPRIEVVRGGGPLLPAEELLAVVTESPLPGLRCIPPDRPETLADLLEEEILPGPLARLEVDGREVPLPPLAARALANLFSGVTPP